MSAALLVASALLRSWRRHPWRALASLLGGTIGISLATGVLVVTFAVEDAIQKVQVTPLIHADLVVQARSASGMSQQVVDRVLAAAGPSKSAALAYVNTRLAPGGDPVEVVGITPALSDFVSSYYSRQFPVSDLGPPGGLWAGEAWARAHGLSPGSKLRLQSAGGTSTWTLRGLLKGDLPNSGAIAVGALTQVTAAAGRPGTTDAIYLRAAPGMSVGGLKTALAEAAGGAATVGDPNSTADPYQTSFASVRSLLSVFAVIGVLSAAAVLFLCWRLQIEDERTNIARFRLYGVALWQLALGSGVVLLAFMVVSAGFGLALGIGIGSGLRDFESQLIELTQLAGQTTTPVLAPVLGGLGASLAIFAIAWASSLYSFMRVPVIEAVSGRRQAPARALRTTIVLCIALALAAAAVVIVTFVPAAAGAGLLLLLGSAVGLALVVPALAGGAIASRGGFLQLSVGRWLAADSRRSAALISVFAIALMMSLALEGLTLSMDQAIERSVAAWTEADLFALPGPPGASLQDERWPAETPARLAGLPGIAETGSFTFTTLEMDGKRVSLWAWDTAHVNGFVDVAVADGAAGRKLWEALDAGEVAVSSNYARLHGLRPGASVNLPTVDGSRRLRVAALVDDFTSDTGIIFASRQLYRELTGDQRLLNIFIRLAPGASAAVVAAEVRQELSAYPNLNVLTRAQIRQAFQGLTGRLLSAFLVFARVLFVLALLVGTATAAASLGARAGALGVTRLCGVSAAALRRELTLEASAVGLLAWLIALPLGFYLVVVMLQAQAGSSGLLPPPVMPVGLALASLPLAVSFAVASVWAASRGAIRRDIAWVIRYE